MTPNETVATMPPEQQTERPAFRVGDRVTHKRRGGAGVIVCLIGRGALGHLYSVQWADGKRTAHVNSAWGSDLRKVAP